MKYLITILTDTVSVLVDKRDDFQKQVHNNAEVNVEDESKSLFRNLFSHQHSP